MSEENNYNIWDDESTVPESNWFEFEKVGDAVSGELVLEPFEKEGKYGTQTIYFIKTKEGKEYNVSLKNTTHAVQVRQLKGVTVGDTIGFRLKELVDTGKGNPAKSIEVRIRYANRG